MSAFGLVNLHVRYEAFHKGTRTVLEQDVYTALYGFGAGLPVTDEDGRYTRRPASKPS
jgi:hypothetical protein